MLTHLRNIDVGLLCQHMLCLCQPKCIPELRLLFLERIIIPLNSDHKHLHNHHHHHHHVLIGENPGDIRKSGNSQASNSRYYLGNFMDLYSDDFSIQFVIYFGWWPSHPNDRHISLSLITGVVALDSETFQSTQGSLDENYTGPSLCKCELVKPVSVWVKWLP